MTNEELENLNWDDYLGDPSNPNPNQPVVTAEPVVEATPPPQAAEPFLKTRTGSVYKSAEDAAQGIEHKDELIARLRQEAIERTGMDPVSGQPVAKPTTPPKTYQQDPKKFVEDLANAAKVNDAAEYHRVYNQMVTEALSPYAPVMATFAKTQAVEAVAQKSPEFREFYKSNDYTETLSQHQLLRDAIAQGETNPQGGEQLAQLYQMAFAIGQSRKVPEVVRAAAQPTPRPTVTSTSLPSFPGTNGSNATPGMGSSEERQALIKQQEGAGVLNMRL